MVSVKLPDTKIAFTKKPKTNKYPNMQKKVKTKIIPQKNPKNPQTKKKPKNQNRPKGTQTKKLNLSKSSNN